MDVLADLLGQAPAIAGDHLDCRLYVESRADKERVDIGMTYWLEKAQAE